MVQSEVMREYLPFMPEWTPYLMYGVLLIVVLILVWTTKKKIEHYNIPFSELMQQIKLALTEHRQETLARFRSYILTQKKVVRTKYAGFMHVCIFYSIILLFIGTFLVFLEQDILKFFGVESFIRGYFYLAYELVLDTSGLLLLLGLGMAFYRRLVIKPFYLKTSWESLLILGILLYLGLSGFLLEGFRLALHPVEWGVFSYVGFTLSKMLLLILSAEDMLAVYPFFWWSHYFATMLLFVVAPFTVLKHVLLIPLNMALIPFDRPKAKMTTPFLITELEEMDEDSELKIGIASLADLDWKQRLNLAGCINCGRCESVCPAFHSGRELSPRFLVQKLKGTYDGFSVFREHLFDSNLISEEEVWSCTNCGACVEECPAMINHVDYITDLRRYLVSENRLDEQKMSVFANLDQNFNAFGLPSYKRNEWYEELQVPTLEDHPTAEYLYYVGDVSSYDERAQKIVKAFIYILKMAKVDFAILTHEEKNEGEIAKRMGEEGRFQLMAMENIELFNMYEVKKIITHDPHSYSILKNEYPEFGGNFQVIHHSEFILQLIRDNKLPISSRSRERIVFHDPCNLARWNGITEEPRQVLQHVLETPLLEINQSRDRSFCCGAGGGNYWYKVDGKEKISSIRLRQLNEVEPDTIAVGCPYCLLMLEDATRTTDSNVKIRDLAEIVYEQLTNEEKENMAHVS